MLKQVFLSDLHIPYHDAALLDVFSEFLDITQPDEVHLLGDILDCTSISTKFQPPSKDARVERISFELDLTKELLSRFKDCHPSIQFEFHEGNHEDRLRRWLETKGRAFLGFEGMSLRNALGWTGTYYTYNELVKLGRLYVTHGNLIRKHSAASCKAMLEKYGVSLLFGHTHRGGSYYHTTTRGTLAAWENFCACRFDMEYLNGPPNWQQGWSVVHNDMRRKFHVEQIPYIKGCAYYRGETFKRPKLTRITRGLPRIRT